jgi:hypothetical protein
VVVLEPEDEEALEAAYAAYAAMKNSTAPPTDVEMHGELDSPSARGARAAAVGEAPSLEITLRQLEP